MTQLQLINRLPVALFTLRLGVSVVFFVWAADKFVVPDHTAAVFQKFYGIGGISSGISYGLGTLQTLITLAFVTGYLKTWSYGLILVMHTASTLVSFGQYLSPFDNLLFFTAWPMLAACFTLFYLRDWDTLAAIDKPSRPES